MPAGREFSLHDWACLRMELIWIYDHGVAPQSRHSVSKRPRDYWAWYLRQGKGTVRTATREYHLTPGSWLFLPEGKARQDFSDDAAMLSICFSYRWPSGENALKNPGGLLFAGTTYPALERRAAKLEQLVRRHLAEGAPYKLQTAQRLDGPVFLRFQALFISWLELWLEISLRNGAGWTCLPSTDERMPCVARCLNEAQLDGPYPREQLVQETELSEVHLNRLFLSAFGLTPRKYWDRRRLEFARNCLETSSMPVKEIAFRLGFRSDAHFAVWFRRLTQKRPSEWRDIARRQPCG